MRKALASIRSVQAILAMCLLIALFSFAYNGSFSRLIADDYCHAAIAVTKGVLGGLNYWYTSWSGRYTEIVLKTSFGLLDPHFASILPALVITLWIGVTTWTCYQITLLMRIAQPKLTAFLLSLLIIQATLQAAPIVIQSVYWISGVIPYTIPLICITLFSGIFLRMLRQDNQSRLPIFTALGVALLTFLAGGLSEIYVTFQVALIMLMGLISWRVLDSQKRNQAFLLLTSGLIGAVVALILLFTSPGNAVRRALFPPPPPLMLLITKTITSSLSVISVLVVAFGPLAIITALGIAMLMGYKVGSPQQLHLSSTKVRTLLALSGIAAIFLVTAIVAPGVYATSDTPPGRVFIIPAFVLVCTACFWGYIIGASLRKSDSQTTTYTKPWLVIAITVFCLLGPINSLFKNLSQTPILQTYATEWDVFDQTVREQANTGKLNIAVEPFTYDIGAMVGLASITNDPDSSINRCAADYYDVESLIVQPNL